MVRRFLAKMKKEEGQALVEYGLLVALIAVVCIAILRTLGTAVEARFAAVVAAL